MNFIKLQAKVIILLIVLALPEYINAQKDSTRKTLPVNIKFSGFLKNDIIYDSRQTWEAVDGLYTAYPKDVAKDAFGNDINDKSSLTAFSHSTRLKANITGPEFLKAKTSGYIEFDFTGRSNTASVRFRQAFIKLDWKKAEILFGQRWHPLFVTDVFPSVLGLNTGVPFQPFNRSPQLSFSLKPVKNVKLLLSAIFQHDYCNIGPDGKSPEYMQNAGIPNLHAQFQFKSNNVTLGAAYDWKKLQPKMQNYLNGKVYSVDNTISSDAIMGYFKFSGGNMLLKSKVILGENMSEHLLPGGFAVSHTNQITGEETYTASKNLYAWINFLYGKKFQIGFFAGLMENYGFGNNIEGQISARGYDIDRIVRFAPVLYYNYKQIKLCLELESTTADYGEIDFENKGRVDVDETVTNNRIQFSAFLFF